MLYCDPVSIKPTAIQTFRSTASSYRVHNTEPLQDLFLRLQVEARQDNAISTTSTNKDKFLFIRHCNLTSLHRSFVCNCLPEAGDIVTLPMKSISLVVAYSSKLFRKMFHAPALPRCFR